MMNGIIPSSTGSGVDSLRASRAGVDASLTGVVGCYNPPHGGDMTEQEINHIQYVTAATSHGRTRWRYSSNRTVGIGEPSTRAVEFSSGKTDGISVSVDDETHRGTWNCRCARCSTGGRWLDEVATTLAEQRMQENVEDDDGQAQQQRKCDVDNACRS